MAPQVGPERKVPKTHACFFSQVIYNVISLCYLYQYFYGLSKFCFILKVSEFQNEFMKLSFLPKYERNFFEEFCPVVWHSTGQKSFQYLVHVLGEPMTSEIHSDIY